MVNSSGKKKAKTKQKTRRKPKVIRMKKKAKNDGQAVFESTSDKKVSKTGGSVSRAKARIDNRTPSSV